MRTGNNSLTWIVALALILVGTASRGETAPTGTTTVILVRHAEKADGSRDPDLSARGAARAAALARVLADVEIHGVYSSQYRRTKQTLEPVAVRKQRDVMVFPVDGEDLPAYARAFTGRLLDAHAGETVLVAGHSNTVPRLIEALGVTPAPNLDDSDYDDLFVVILEPGGAARLLHLHYGEPDQPVP